MIFRLQLLTQNRIVLADMRAVILNEFVPRLQNGPWQVMARRAVPMEFENAVVVRRASWVIAVCVGSANGQASLNRSEELLSWLPTGVTQIAFVTTFQHRAELQQHLESIPLNTSVWFADEPDHLVHFGRVPFFRLKPCLI
jgi:BsuBI/PstI restriction endonuclease domain